MYNEKIEALISAALADGVLTEKEKQVLFKRAQTEGIDLDEFEMVLDARLVELQKAEKEKAEKSAPKSTKYGDVRKCPVCGAMVPALVGVCPECGYEFSGLDANLSSQKLQAQIDEILADAEKKKIEIQQKSHLRDYRKKGETRSPMDKAIKEVDYGAEKRIINVIKNFSVPNTKSDLFEFTVSLQSKINGVYGNEYYEKLEECIAKIKLLFPNDSIFKAIIETRQQKHEELQREKRKKMMIFLPVGIILSLVILYLEWHFLEWKWGWKLLLAFYTVPLPLCVFIPMTDVDEKA